MRLRAVILLIAAMLVRAEARGALSTLVDNGPSSNRVDIVFVGDGYTQAQLDAGLYLQHIASYTNHMFGAGNLLNDPFARYAKFFNVHAISVASAQSGADKPYDNIFVNTALDATFENTSDTRLLTIDDSKANLVRSQNLAGTRITADMQLAVVNESKYGGAGGGWATFAGRNSSAHEIALHELGHSFSDLGDEYFYTSDHYTGPEPTEPNVTKSASGAKWSRWMGFDDPRGSALDIGAFEGGRYAATGIYRPSDNSKMRALNQPFNAVAREELILDIYNFVDPLDNWLHNGSTVQDQPLWVDLVDPAVHVVEWYVDDVLVPGAAGESFDARAFGIGPGNHAVRARAYDSVLDHVGDGEWLDLVRKDLPRLTQTVSWTISISPPQPGDFNGDGLVNGVDLAAWGANFGLAETATAADGDADDDGDVDGGDFLAWQRHVTDGATADGPQHSVPEPPRGSPVALAAVGALALTGRRRGIRR